MTLTIGSLFSGIGGLELGLERAGLGPVVWQVEKDDYARRVLAKHWPDATRYEDVKDVGGANLVPVDVICGGFPCQDISYAGAGAGLDGERSGLWFEFARIVREMGPRYVVVENVAALLTRGVDAVLGTLADLGYDAEWSCVRAADVGAPHLRDRLFLVAYAASDRRGQGDENGRGRGARVGAWPEHRPGRSGEDVADADGERELQPQGPVSDERRWIGDSGADELAHSQGERRRPLWEGHTSQAGADDIPGHAGERTGVHPWETEPDVGRVAHGVPRRVDRLRGLGNAVVPQVAEVVGRVVLALDAELRGVA